MAGAVGGQHRDRGFAVASEHGDHQIGCLGFGGQTCGGAASLDIHHQQGQLQADGQTDGFAFEGEAGAGCGGDADVSAVGCADGCAHRGDFVFGLEGADAEVLALGEFVEHVGGGRDRIRTEEQRPLGLLAGGDQTPGECCGAVDVGVGAGLQLGGADFVGVVEELCGFAVGVAGFEGGRVGGDDLFFAFELGLDPVQRGFGGAVVEPRDEAESEEVLGAVGIAGFHADGFAGFFGERCHRDENGRVVV